jgi:hypothetical protein
MHLSKLKKKSTAWNAPEQIKEKFQRLEMNLSKLKENSVAWNAPE